MGLVIEALFSIALVAVIIWAVLLYRSAAADRRAAREAEIEARRRTERDAALARPGEPLRCLNCNTQFPGPLPDTGCPNCHLSTLVIPEAEYLRSGDNYVNSRRNSNP